MIQRALEFIGQHYNTLWNVSRAIAVIGVVLLVIGLIRRRRAVNE